MSRQIDALIAEHVFGYKLHKEDCNSFWVDKYGDEPDHGHDYSTRIEDAWLVIEKMQELGWDWYITSDSGGTAQFTFADEGKFPQHFHGWGIPETICRAALFSLNYGKNEWIEE